MSSTHEITLTIQWMSGEIFEITHDTSRGLYSFKRAILSMKQDTTNPFLLSLYRNTQEREREREQEQEQEWVECSDSTVFQAGERLYAIIRQPITRERLYYVYTLGNGTLWRFTYETPTIQKQVSIIEYNGAVCDVQAYRDSKKTGQTIPWIYTIESFIEGVVTDEQVKMNLVYLWNHRQRVT